MAGRFGSVLTAMVTPFDAEGALDVDAAVALARWLQANGNDGLVVAGTTGEAPTLTDAEHLDLIAAVSEAVTIPVVAGTGSNDTHHAIEMTAKASALGIAGCLVVTPYYNRPSQAGLEAHFKAVAAATALPVIVYDIPIRTGRKVSTDLLLRLARDVTNIVAVKDAAGNPSESAVLLARAPSDLELYSGDDSFTLPSARDRRRRRHRRRHALVGRRAQRDDLVVREGRRRRCTRDERPPARVVRVRDERRHAEPDPDQGDDARARPRGRSVPSPARPCARGHRGARAAGHRQPAAGVTSRAGGSPNRG